MLFEIKNRFSGSVMFSLETESLKLCVEAAVKSRADLTDADLTDANLADANLAGAYLADANLAGAYLADANLARAYLADANLARANLAGAYLAGANLARANLAGAKIYDGIVINRAPICIANLTWPILIFENHMWIGCQFHSHEDWAGFSDEKWLEMGGKDALKLKRDYLSALMAMCKAHSVKS